MSERPSTARRPLAEEALRRGKALRRRRTAVRRGATGAVLAGAVVTVVVLRLSGQTTPPVTPAHTSTAITSPSGTSFPPSTATTSPTGTTSPPQSTTPGTESVAIPLVSCSTTFGLTTATTAALPSSITLTIPTDLVGKVSFYADEQDAIRVLAPSGMSCGATRDADGSGDVVVYPSGGTPPRAGESYGAQPAEGVVVDNSGPSEMSTLDQACPLFSTATSLLRSSLGQPCPQQVPADQSDTALSSTAVAFSDPPGTAGTGDPSGGTDEASGVVTYSPSSNDGSYLETCTLPAADEPICGLGTNELVALYDTGSTSTEPVLGRAAGDFAHGSGFGEVEPSQIYNGGDPTGELSKVSWTSWGGATAVGSGTSDYVAPGGTVDNGTEEKATVVAFKLGECGGKLMYEAVEWYFPQHGGKFDPSSYEDVCSGSYVGEG